MPPTRTTSRSSGDNQFLLAAEAYARRGWPVFPLLPRDKAPYPRTRGFLDASTDRNVILNRWQLFPESNIGLPTGVVFDVLDIDGPDALPNLREVLGDDYRHEGPVASTGKGWHLYFEAVPGGRNRAGLLGGHVDYRGAGGYVVAPPSIHPSGRRYVWADGRTFKLALPPVPQSLRDIVLRETTEYTRPPIIRRDDGSTDAGGTDYRNMRPSIIETVEGLGRKVTMKGANYVTNCLFHNDPGPSMTLYITDDSFYCYGCEAYGDSLNLLQGRDINGKTFI